MMRAPLITLLLLLTTATFFSQETLEPVNTIENQFDEIYKKSSSYQTYKVISKDKFNKLKANILDSLERLEATIAKKELLLVTANNTETALKDDLNETKKALETAIKKENTISFFGIPLSKLAYNFLMWILVIILIAGMSYFVFKYLRSNILTKKAQNDLSAVNEEYEESRKKGLEREQKLRRQLQDEIMKHQK
ncbi:hypothetical protein [uncultured Polaribacter sp.]|uniref:hypothetical protein n=1 Tax=uncultured Polaribacter sp. TaxID=174711 RepID=UPI002617AA7E|nr:hypothetical protein [uncultured Polaribacter sp.]